MKIGIDWRFAPLSNPAGSPVRTGVRDRLRKRMVISLVRANQGQSLATTVLRRPFWRPTDDARCAAFIANSLTRGLLRGSRAPRSTPAADALE
jgi:hypothetical protein